MFVITIVFIQFYPLRERVGLCFQHVIYC